MSNVKSIVTPSRMTVRVGPDGISAVNDRGFEIRFAMTASAAGFNPLELQSAALGICTAITLRNELRRAPGAKHVPEFELVVEGVKADDLPSRLARLDVRVTLPEFVAAEDRAGILHRAEEACTIANTLLSRPDIAIEG